MTATVLPRSPTPLDIYARRLGLDAPELEELLTAIDDRLDVATTETRALLLPCRHAILAELRNTLAA